MSYRIILYPRSVRSSEFGRQVLLRVVAFGKCQMMVMTYVEQCLRRKSYDIAFARYDIISHDPLSSLVAKLPRLPWRFACAEHMTKQLQGIISFRQKQFLCLVARTAPCSWGARSAPSPWGRARGPLGVENGCSKTSFG